MRKMRKIDYILEDGPDTSLIFRFYPRQSSCHSFGENPPTGWDDVYKVYYSYKIIERWDDGRRMRVVFDSGCDECSVIDEVSYRIQQIVKGVKTIKLGEPDDEKVISLLNSEILPFGYGVSWNISKRRGGGLYEIMLWNNNGTGYRFLLQKEKLREFGEYLNECCEYMLAHGDPI